MTEWFSSRAHRVVFFVSVTVLEFLCCVFQVNNLVFSSLDACEWFSRKKLKILLLLGFRKMNYEDLILPNLEF